MPEQLTDLSVLLPIAMQFCPAAPNPTMIQNLRLAANEFCAETLCWREVFDVVFPEASPGPQPISVVGATTVKIERAKVAGSGHRELDPVVFSEINLDEWDNYTTQSGEPDKITQLNDNTIHINPYKACTVTVEAYMAPIGLPQWGVSGGTTLQAVQNVIPAFLATNHGEALAWGGAARTLIVPGTTYHNPALATSLAAMFENAKAMRHGQRLRGQQRAKPRVKAHYL